MAILRMFLSSTCYDLSVVRSQLSNFIIDLGHDPILSEHSDVLFDPRVHTHTSCVQEVANCDMVILIVGSRFGGVATPKSLEIIDIEKLREGSAADNFANGETIFSVTQVEVLRAIEAGIPIFTFVEAGVWNDHFTYEKNKHKEILKEIEFPNIDKQETAEYIFEFINFLRLRTENNSIIEFSKLDDIETHLKKQWSALLQRLLYEQRTREIESRRIDYLANQIADLKTAVITSISSEQLKETAKGAIKFRMLIDFVYSIGTRPEPINIYEVLTSQMSWSDLLEKLNVTEIRPDNNVAFPHKVILLRPDKTYYRSRFSLQVINRLSLDWEGFRGLSSEVKLAIIRAVVDNLETRPIMSAQFISKPLDDPGTLQDDDIPF